MTLDQWGRWSWGKQLFLSFILDTQESSEETLPKGWLFFSRVSTWNLTGVKEATFSRKNVSVLPSVPPHSNHWRSHWKLMCFVPSWDCAGFPSFLWKTEALDDPNCAWPFSSVLGEEKGVMGTVDATAFQVVIMRQNVCFRRQVDICISYLISNHSKHAHGAYKGEVILPSHLWDLCLIRCLFVTLKFCADHSWASSALSTSVQFTTRTVLLWGFAYMAVS